MSGQKNRNNLFLFFFVTCVHVSCRTGSVLYKATKEGSQFEQLTEKIFFCYNFMHRLKCNPRK